MISMRADAESFRRYLLGEATEAETEAIERSYLAKDEVLEAIGAAEQDLIDDYLDDQLDPERRRRFEGHYLASPVHRRRVTISLALRDRPVSWRRRMPVLPIVAVAATLVITVLGSWLLLSRPAPDRLVTITLPTVLVRGESETPTARIGEDAAGVELRLDRGDWRAAPPFQVTLITVEGEEVWRGTAVTSPVEREGGPGSVLSVTIPAEHLPADDYIVILSTGTADSRELQRYYFRVVRP